MIFKRGIYRNELQFQDDTGTLADPTSPELQIQKPDGTWANLSAPTKQNSKTGLYGFSLDMSNATTYPVGKYTFRIAGTVPTAKEVGATWEISLSEYSFDEIMSSLNNATYGLSAIKTLNDTMASYIDTEVAAIKVKTDNLPASPAATGQNSRYANIS
jgi:hypothetical protein